MYRFLKSITSTKELIGPVQYAPAAYTHCITDSIDLISSATEEFLKEITELISIEDLDPLPERQMKLMGTPVVVMPDTAKDSEKDSESNKAKGLKVHLVQDVAAGARNGKAWIDHSAGLLWWLPPVNIMTIIDAEQNLRELNSTRFLDRSGWRFATWPDFKNAVFDEVLSKNLHIVEIPPKGSSKTREMKWGLAIQTPPAVAHIACLITTAKSPDSKSARYCYVCDL